MSEKYLEIGDKCPVCKVGVMDRQRIEPCSCHISPPFSACVDAPMLCTKCKYNPDIELGDEIENNQD